MKKKHSKLGKRIISAMKEYLKTGECDVSVYDRDPDGNLIRTKMKMKARPR